MRRSSSASFVAAKSGPVPHDPAEGKRPSMWQEARAGVGYVVSNRYLRSIAACTGTFNLFGNISGAVLILYLVKEDRAWV